MLLLAYKHVDDLGEAIIINANLGGDNCHRGALLGALLGAAGRALPARLRDGLHPSASIPAATEGFLQVVADKGRPAAAAAAALVQSLPPAAGAPMESLASACKT